MYQKGNLGPPGQSRSPQTSPNWSKLRKARKTRNVNHRLSLWSRNVLLLDGLPGFPQFGPVGAGLRTFRLGWRTKISFLVHFLKQQVIDILSLNDFIKMILLSFIIFLTKSLNDFLLESHKESFKSLNVLEWDFIPKSEDLPESFHIHQEISDIPSSLFSINHFLVSSSWYLYWHVTNCN